jgi:hypothetical protein
VTVTDATDLVAVLPHGSVQRTTIVWTRPVASHTSVATTLTVTGVIS